MPMTFKLTETPTQRGISHDFTLVTALNMRAFNCAWPQGTQRQLTPHKDLRQTPRLLNTGSCNALLDI